MGAFSAAYGELLKTDLQPANYKARIDLGNMLLAGNKIDDAQAQAAAAMARSRTMPMFTRCLPASRPGGDKKDWP
jgi:hypothetical protein